MQSYPQKYLCLPPRTRLKPPRGVCGRKEYAVFLCSKSGSYSRRYHREYFQVSNSLRS